MRERNVANWWPPEVQAREHALFHVEMKDTWIFRKKDDGTYFAVGGVDAIGVNTILMIADIVKFTSQRFKDIQYSEKRGYYR